MQFTVIAFIAALIVSVTAAPGSMSNFGSVCRSDKACLPGQKSDAIQQLVHTKHPKNNRILVIIYRVALYTSNDDTPDEPPNLFDRSATHSSGNMLTATMRPDGSLHTLYRLY
ncbi:hypothetical protein BDEG_21330 [Batrachochytrium dendrobatidis JEL423]|uniref:Uncharacterized protein n=1 Tax=Batrachochytrium dendrobatidis (strain JEL423) TaxID=403673 RepID=A0A177WB04_BATDL|nr:hypothetical protein BDEG_21330 [Batrachochytrium dendrobatidis JEL423]